VKTCREPATKETYDNIIFYSIQPTLQVTSATIPDNTGMRSILHWIPQHWFFVSRVYCQGCGRNVVRVMDCDLLHML